MDAARYAARRRHLSDALGGEPILLVGHRPVARNFLANTYPFRQDSTFFYYLGVDLPGAAALIERDGTTLFLPEPESGDALWHGEAPGFDAWQARCGAESVRPTDQLQPGAFHSLPLADPGANAEAVRLSGQALDPQHPDAESPLMRAVIDQRIARDEAELDAMREAMRVTARAHWAAMAATAPGVTENEIQALVDAVFVAAGMRPAYPSIVTVRGEVLHGHAAGNVLAEGDLLLVDAGAEHPSGYATDVTRTWPASGRYSPRQRAAYDAVLAANRAGTALCRPGAAYRDVHLEAARVLSRFLVDEGLLRGDVDGLVEQGAHAVFFPHGVGHLLGLDVHDMELFGDAAGYEPGRVRSRDFGLAFLRLDRTLRPGVVVTVEPGFYVVPAILRDPDLRDRHADSVDWDRAESWLGFGGIRVEDDILVTIGGPENLSQEIVSAADEVEAVVGRGPSPKARLSAPLD